VRIIKIKKKKKGIKIGKINGKIYSVHFVTMEKLEGRDKHQPF